MYHFSFFTYLCLFLRLPDQKGVGHPDNALPVQLCWTASITLRTARSVIRLLDQKGVEQSRNAGKVGMGNFF